jgi:hypothetical protein
MPEGYAIGDRLFWTGESVSVDAKNSVVYGKRGEVTGVGSDPESVAVLFPGNEESLHCYIGALSRTTPPKEDDYPPGTEHYFWYQLQPDEGMSGRYKQAPRGV